MECTKWRLRQRHPVVLSSLLTAAATMIQRSSLEVLKQSTNGQIMVSVTVLSLLALQINTE